MRVGQLDRAAVTGGQQLRLAGAVLGALLISGLNSFLADAENGINIGFQLTLPSGTRLVTIGAVMALVLILRPSGITGGREFALPRRRRPALRAGPPAGLGAGAPEAPADRVG